MRMLRSTKDRKSDNGRSRLGFSPRVVDDRTPAWAKAHATVTFPGGVHHE